MENVLMFSGAIKSFDEVMAVLADKAASDGNRLTVFDVLSEANEMFDFDELADELGKIGITVYDPEVDISILSDSDTEYSDGKDLNCFSLYLGDIGNYPLLTSEEEIALGQRSLMGDKSAKDQLTCHNLRLVVSMAKRYRGNGLDMLDLVQEGSLGLMKAVDKFDPSMGYRLSTYAVWWIKQNIERALGSVKIIRLPVYMTELIKKYKRVSAAFAAKNKREPTEDELMKLMGISRKKVKEVLFNLVEVSSLDVPVGEKDEDTVGSFVPSDEKTPEQILVERAYYQEVRDVLKVLTPRENKVVRMRMGFVGGEPYTLEKTGAALGITRERVRQIEAKALKKLRMPHVSAHLKDAS